MAYNLTKNPTPSQNWKVGDAVYCIYPEKPNVWKGTVCEIERDSNANIINLVCADSLGEITLPVYAVFKTYHKALAQIKSSPV